MDDESMIRTTPDNRAPIPLPIVTRHRIDWEASNLDLGVITAQRLASLGGKVQQGCWYLNPRFTISCRAPTGKFFAKARQLRSSWLHTCRQSLSNYGQKQLARQAEKEGREATIRELHLFNPEQAADELPPPFVNLSSVLSPDQRKLVFEGGQIAKAFGFSGILFVEGEPIPPRTWQAMAAEIPRD